MKSQFLFLFDIYVIKLGEILVFTSYIKEHTKILKLTVKSPFVYYFINITLLSLNLKFEYNHLVWISKQYK